MVSPMRYFKKNEEAEQHKWFFTCPCQMETGTFSLILEKMTLPFQHSLSHEVSICNIKNSKQRRQLKEPSSAITYTKFKKHPLRKHTFLPMNSQGVSSGEGGNDFFENLTTLGLNNEFPRSGRTTGETYVPDHMGPTNPGDMPTNPGDMLSSPTEENAEAVEKNSPAMIFLPSQSTREVLNEMIDATNNGVALTGAAATGSMGPLIGKVEIGELKDSYYFRVSLPGVSMDKREFNCVIRADGKVTIQGILTTGEQIVSNESGVFRMLTQNLGPPGPFTVSFQLPGPVNNQEVKSHLACGFLEAIVKKM